MSENKNVKEVVNEVEMEEAVGAEFYDDYDFEEDEKFMKRQKLIKRVKIGACVAGAALLGGLVYTLGKNKGAGDAMIDLTKDLDKDKEYLLVERCDVASEEDMTENEDGTFKFNENETTEI